MMNLIIGGGGTGFHYSALLKEKHPSEKAIVVEEHKEIGEPVQCTGILTNEVERLLPKHDLKKFVVNKITQTTIHSPDNKVDLKISPDFIISNEGFVQYLADRAEKAGVVLKDKTRFVETKGSKAIVRNTDTKKLSEVKFDRLIGADGPASLVARQNDLFGKREFLTGVQATVKLKDLEQDKIDFFPSVGEYAWCTPESEDTARIGVAARGNAAKIFDSFVKRFDGKILARQGGPIPLHNPRQVVKKENVALIGDSALQIKNTTGGGIIPGMRAAEALSDSFEKYDTSKLDRELYAHYFLHKMLSKYSDKDWARLVLKAKSVEDVLQNTNRDNAYKMLFKLALKPKMFTEGFRACFKSL